MLVRGDVLEKGMRSENGGRPHVRVDGAMGREVRLMAIGVGVLEELQISTVRVAQPTSIHFVDIYLLCTTTNILIITSTQLTRYFKF